MSAKATPGGKRRRGRPTLAAQSLDEALHRVYAHDQAQARLANALRRQRELEGIKASPAAALQRLPAKRRSTEDAKSRLPKILRRVEDARLRRNAAIRRLREAKRHLQELREAGRDCTHAEQELAAAQYEDAVTRRRARRAAYIAAVEAECVLSVQRAEAIREEYDCAKQEVAAARVECARTALPKRPRNEFEQQAMRKKRGPKARAPQPPTWQAAQLAAYLVQADGESLKSAAKQAAKTFNLRSVDTVRHWARRVMHGPTVIVEKPGETVMGVRLPGSKKRVRQWVDPKAIAHLFPPD